VVGQLEPPIPRRTESGPAGLAGATVSPADSSTSRTINLTSMDLGSPGFSPPEPDNAKDPPHAGYLSDLSAREICHPALKCHKKLDALIEQLMAIEKGILIVVQSLAKLHGVWVEIAKIKVGAHVFSGFSNQTNPAIQIVGQGIANPSQRHVIIESLPTSFGLIQAMNWPSRCARPTRWLGESAH